MKFNMNKSHRDAVQEVRLIYDFISSQKKFSKLIPEVRTNISVAIPDAKEKEDVAAIDGRITIVNGMPKACGDIKFGVSDHTARLILTTKKFDNSYNIALNLRYSPKLIEKLTKVNNLKLGEIDRMKEPEQLKGKEHSTMQWLIKKVVDRLGGIPDIIWDKGAIGKEPIIRLFGRNAKEIIKKLEKILSLID
ncbi:MAG: thiamine-phosphate synthase family protein [Candidatus Lokiarchaeota archaeon]